MGSFVLRVEGDSLQMVSFRVKVWATYIVFLSNGIFSSQNRERLISLDLSENNNSCQSLLK